MRFVRQVRLSPMISVAAWERAFGLTLVLGVTDDVGRLLPEALALSETLRTARESSFS